MNPNELTIGEAIKVVVLQGFTHNTESICVLAGKVPIFTES